MWILFNCWNDKNPKYILVFEKLVQRVDVTQIQHGTFSSVRDFEEEY